MNTNFSINRFFDFYFLEAMRAGITMAKSANPDLDFSRSVERLEQDVNKTFNKYVEIIEERVRLYIWAAALGEARHAHRMCENAIEEIDGNNMSRTSVYDLAHKFPLTAENIQTVYDIFEQDNWSTSSFGGENWQNIVDALNLEGATFIDHVIDLEHNGGNVFTKETKDTDVRFNNQGLYKVRHFFDFKRDCDILHKRFGYEAEVTFKVYNLLERYSNIISETNVNVTISRDGLSGEHVDWGNKTLTMVKAENSRHCDECDDLVDEDDAYYSPDGDTLCSDCWNYKYFYCDKCGEVGYQEDAADLSSGKYCKNCAGAKGYAQCEYCAEWSDDYCVLEDTSEVYCQDCAKKHCDYCEECNEWHSDIEYHYQNDHDNYCEECEKLVDDLEEHNLEEHYEPAELGTDGDGIFQNPVTFLDHQIHKSFTIGGQEYTQYIDPNQQGKDLVVVANPVSVNNWSIVAEKAGLYFGKGTKEDMLAKMQEVQFVTDWSKVSGKEDWEKLPYEVKAKIIQIMGYKGYC